MAGTTSGAKKAWKTIRAKKEKRRQAALKAWKTIRGNSGRQAALKAWKTRRKASVSS